MNKYQNKGWLKEKYLGEKLSTCQIAKLCNCGQPTIWTWLKKHGVLIRSRSEANHIRYKKQIGNDNYYNKEWLEKKYLKEKLSMLQIAKLCGCGYITVRRYMKKFKIPIRLRCEGIHLIKVNHCNLSEEAKQWIDGELLGDACLVQISKYSTRFQYSSKHKEYINYISETLDSFGIKQGGKINIRQNKIWGNYVYDYHSLHYEELLPIHKRWYPEPERKKIIPRDLKLTPLVLRQEHIGDGCLQRKKNRKPYIELATCGFSIPSVEWLVKELVKLGFGSKRQPSTNVIRISTYSTKAFLNYIGDCPVECYQYKFNY